ncbi:hypothetical protein BBP40_008311 [Aspergillus hancockii]|nr:hypothetical protein BBP40_008311 [Aspergillus hancockii]
MPMVTAATGLRRTLEDLNSFIVAPGVYDGLSARIALSVGLDALYMKTGTGIADSLHGQIDLGICTLSDMRANAEMLSNLSPAIPVIADADTGYGGPIMTKKCGHLGGKILVDKDTYVTRIRVAMQAWQRISSDIVIIARTDTLQTHGYEESVARLRAARDAGRGRRRVSTEMTPQMLFRVCGLDESVKIDAEAGGAAFESGVDLK